MVFVVERHLPGLSQSDLLRRLARREALEDLQAERPTVRCLGSTVVLMDEACLCQFEGPSEMAVAEANGKVSVSFDRIVPAVAVRTDERRSAMSVHATMEAPARQRRRWLVMGAAVLAAGAIGAVLAFSVGTGSKAGSSRPTGVAIPASPTRVSAPVIMSLTPAQLAGGALGLGYALPTVQHGPTMASVLASLSPQTRRFTKAIMSLTFAQLAAGAAGSP